MTEMSPVANPLLARLRAGERCANGWSMLADPFATEVMASAPWASITVDLQHGLHDYRSAVAALQAVGTGGATMLARVPTNEPGIVGKLLDAGFWGIICPMVNDVADARRLVDACLYHPVGERSNGPLRAALRSGAAYQRRANDEVLVLPQIETREAVGNLEAILDVQGIGGVYVGPSDLALTMDLPPVLDSEEPALLAIFERIVTATAARGQVAAIHTRSPAYARRMFAMGFALVTVASDVGTLAEGMHRAVAALRD